MKKRLILLFLSSLMILIFFLGCQALDKDINPKKIAENIETEKEKNSKEVEKDSEEESFKFYKNNIKMSNFEIANLDEVLRSIDNPNGDTILVDARPQEIYAGWALEGAKNGGHLKNALLFSSRWLDCEYSENIPREVYLDRALKSQGITKDKNIIVYDYLGEQAAYVAQFFKDKGLDNIKVFVANQLIDEGTLLESNNNYKMYLPTEIVKSISEVKTGQSSDLTPEAKGIVGENLEHVILIDVGWGNAKSSTYFTVGHVPGSIHINTDSYERPRVYIPEKRAEYAKEWRLIPLEEFRDTVCPQYGITKNSIVIISGAETTPSTRLGYMLRSLGVQVYIMNGGLTAWKYNDYDLDVDEETLVIPKPVESFGSDTIVNPKEILWMDSIKAILNGDISGQVADSRSRDEWDGKYSGYSYHDLAGRIEGSIWCPLGSKEEGEFFENVDNTSRTRMELIKHMEDYGLDISQPVAFFCGDSWGAAKIAYICQSNDIETIKQWGNGWIPWSNMGNEFIDHTGKKVHYEKYRDTLLDKDGKDVRDNINILD